MSAFMCSDSHIEAIVIGAYRCKEARCQFNLHLDELSAEATELKKANETSVDARYGAKSKVMIADSNPIEIDTVSYARTARRSPVELLKLVACLEYQSCEFEEWKDSKAARLLNEYRVYIVNSLPGYEAAPWDI